MWHECSPSEIQLAMTKTLPIMYSFLLGAVEQEEQ